MILLCYSMLKLKTHQVIHYVDNKSFIFNIIENVDKNHRFRLNIYLLHTLFVSKMLSFFKMYFCVAKHEI